EAQAGRVPDLEAAILELEMEAPERSVRKGRQGLQRLPSWNVVVEVESHVRRGPSRQCASKDSHANAPDHQRREIPDDPAAVTERGDDWFCVLCSSDEGQPLAGLEDAPIVIAVHSRPVALVPGEPLKRKHGQRRYRLPTGCGARSTIAWTDVRLGAPRKRRAQSYVESITAALCRRTV